MMGRVYETELSSCFRIGFGHAGHGNGAGGAGRIAGAGRIGRHHRHGQPHRLQRAGHPDRAQRLFGRRPAGRGHRLGARSRQHRRQRQHLSLGRRGLCRGARHRLHRRDGNRRPFRSGLTRRFLYQPLVLPQFVDVRSGPHRSAQGATGHSQRPQFHRRPSQHHHQSAAIRQWRLQLGRSGQLRNLQRRDGREPGAGRYLRDPRFGHLPDPQGLSQDRWTDHLGR